VWQRPDFRTPTFSSWDRNARINGSRQTICWRKSIYCKKQNSSGLTRYPYHKMKKNCLRTSQNEMFQRLKKTHRNVNGKALHGFEKRSISVRLSSRKCTFLVKLRTYLLLFQLSLLRQRNTVAFISDWAVNSVKNGTSTLLEHCVTGICRQFFCVQNLDKQWLAISNLYCVLSKQVSIHSRNGRRCSNYNIVKWAKT
jgi:hypothetical protein